MTQVSQVFPSCCCQTLQSALLPVVYTTQFSFLVWTIWTIFTNIYYYLEITIHCQTLIIHVNCVQYYVHMYIGVYSILFYSILFYSISYLLILLFVFTIVIVFWNTTVLWLLWQTNFPVCGTIKEHWFWIWFWPCLISFGCLWGS